MTGARNAVNRHRTTARPEGPCVAVSSGRRSTRRRTLLALSAVVTASVLVSARAAAQTAREHRDLVYATVDGRPLGLDLYMPAGATQPPLIVWLHGGAWTTGTKAQVPKVFVEGGFATASVDFRQSTEARFPAQVHDIKAAIRFLRARGAEYGYRTDRIAIAGSSSAGTWRHWLA